MGARENMFSSTSFLPGWYRASPEIDFWLARRLAAARLDVYWLDNYLASRGREAGRPFVVPFPPRWMADGSFPPHLRPADEDDPRRWPPEWRRRVRYAFGVGDADLAVAALERMLRG